MAYTDTYVTSGEYDKNTHKLNLNRNDGQTVGVKLNEVKVQPKLSWWVEP